MSGKCKLSCKMCLAGENIYICVSVAAPESLKLILNRSFFFVLVINTKLTTMFTLCKYQITIIDLFG